MTVNEKLSRVGALQSLAQQLNAKIPGKVSDLTNDANYQTEEQMTAAINAKVSSTYRAGGSVAFADLPELSAANLGLVVNVTDAFTTTESFLEGTGKAYPAGTNVAVVQSGEAYLYDVLAGFIDLSGYARAEDVVTREKDKGLSSNDYTDADKAKLDSFEVATDEEINAMLAEVLGT